MSFGWGGPARGAAGARRRGPVWRRLSATFLPCSFPGQATLDLGFPDVLVAQDLGDAKVHRREDVGDALEEREGKEVHEADLRLAQLDDRVSHRGREEGGRDAEVGLHRRLTCKLVGEDGGPAGGDVVFSCLRGWMSDGYRILETRGGEVDCRLELAYHVADVGTLDQQRAHQGPPLVAHSVASAADDARVGVDRLLQLAQLLHVVKVQAHVGGQDGVDEELAHVGRHERCWPVPAQDLREGGAVEGFEDGAVIVELGERGFEVDEEGVVDAGVADVMTDGGDEERERLERS